MRYPRQFVRWCKWVSNGRQLNASLRGRIESLECKPQTSTASLQSKVLKLVQITDESFPKHAQSVSEQGARICDLEAALITQRDEFQEQLREIRERLDLPQKRKSSGRPFNVLAKVAAQGAARLAANGEPHV